MPNRYDRAACLGVALLCILPVVARAQTAAPGLDPRKPISQYIRDTWTIDEGLPQGSVFGIAQGRDGYLWLATEAGLVRFDGVAFTTSNVANTRGLSDNYINTMIVDRSDTVWAGTWVGGVTWLHRAASDSAPGAADTRVNYLYQDRAGTIWAALNPGIARREQGRFRRLPGYGMRPITIGEAADGSLLVGQSNGLSIVQGDSVDRWHPPGGRIDEAVWTIFLDRRGGMWFGTPAALYHSAGGRLRRYGKAEGLPDGGVTAIVETRHGQIWLGMNDRGIARLAGERIESFAEGPLDDAVKSMMEDREGSLWIGTLHGGLVRLREPLLPALTTREGLASNIVWSVYGDGRESVWIGTSEGLNQLRNGRLTSFTARDGLPGNSVSTTLLARDGTFWVGTSAGMARRRGGRWERLRAPFPETRVTAFTEDRSGALWIGGNAGLYRLKDGVLHDYTEEAGLTDVRVRTIVEDRDGALWIGTHGLGLLRLMNGRFTSLSTRNGLSNDVVESLFADEHGLWVGTTRGLNLVRAGHIIVMPLSGAVFMTDMYQILKDDTGHLWLSSNQGLARVSQTELLDAAGGRRDSVPVHEVVSLDGRRRIEFNGASQNAGWKGPDGRLWFPSIKGLIVVDPARLANNPIPPPVHIEALLVDGREVPLEDGVEVPPGGGALELRYTATSLLIPQRVTFRYRLEGYEADWVEAGNRRVAYYTRVPGGRYRFRVIAANNAGVWNEAGAVLAFRLKPHFWQTWWFYVLLLLALSGAIVLIFRLRTRRVRQLAEHLSSEVNERTAALRQEVTERRHAEERYKHLFDSNPQPVWVTDRDTLVFLAVNDATARHYGYTREEFTGMTLGDLQPEGQGAALPEWIRAAGDGWRGTSMWQQQKKDGTIIEVEVAAQAFTYAGRPAALIVASDVTARQDLEERLRQSQKMEAVGQLAGGIAHDLNNVLTAVMAHVDLAVATLPEGAPLLADLTQAQAATHRGAGMIRKLLGFSRRDRLVLKPLLLESLVDELVVTLKRLLPEQIEIVVTRDDLLPAVAADAGAVQQIVLNLATNARDAMPEGGRLTMHVGLAGPDDAHMAKHEWSAPGNYVVLRMTDNGSGMAAGVLARIFEPYYTTKAADHGTGLGMAMVYGLMKQHMGYVLVDSSPGEGTEVRLYFPVSTEPMVVMPPVVRQPTQQGNQKILVVEDQESVRAATIRALNRAGYEVLSAHDGEEGLQLWRTHATTIDLIISDAVMPRMGGLALYTAVSQEHPGIRFILTSGYLGAEGGGDTPTVDLPFLPKPWTVSDLLTAVRKALKAA